MDNKILTFDIETMANLVWSWQTRSRGGWSAVETEEPWYVLGFGAKWLGKKTKYYGLEDYKGYKPTITRKDGSMAVRKPNTIEPLMQDMWNLLDEAEVVMGWNSKAFDVKKVNAWFMALGMPPYSPIKQIDLMQEKKKLTASNSNKLDDTGEEWGIGRKVKHEGFPLWMGCAEGDPKALRKMKKYCIQDVDLTERAYLHERAWIKTHPNMALLLDKLSACPKCGVEGQLIKQGTRMRSQANRVQEWSCKACKSWSISRISEKANKPQLVN